MFINYNFESNNRNCVFFNVIDYTCSVGCLKAKVIKNSRCPFIEKDKKQENCPCFTK